MKNNENESKEKKYDLIYKLSFKKKGVTVITCPLENEGYYYRDESAEAIFVKSKLPRAERSHVVNTLLARHVAA